VVIDIEAASISRFDVAGRDAGLTDDLATDTAVVLGRDFVGTISAVGAGVSLVEVGYRVAGVLPPAPLVSHGTFAEKVAVPVSLLAPVPDGIGIGEAAGIGLAGITAVDAVNTLGLHAGDTVFISGLAGGGTFALQLAKRRGSRVIVAAKPGEERDLAWSLGADHVVGTVDVAGHIAKFYPGGVAKALHTTGDPVAAAATVRPGGILTSVLDAGPADIGRADIDVVTTTVVPNGHKLTDLLFKAAARQLRVMVSQRFTFDQLGEALTAYGNSIGSVVLTR
jgi:NADPH:quinone reductase-like Zn-dependent oxidoreductase